MATASIAGLFQISSTWNSLGASHWFVRAKQAALKAGCLEALIVDRNEFFGGTEGGVYLVSGNRIRLPILGATEQMFDAIAHLASNSVPSLEAMVVKKATNRELFDADEVFLAGITCGVIGIVKVDDRVIGTGREGPITKRIREAYRKLTRGEA